MHVNRRQRSIQLIAYSLCICKFLQTSVQDGFQLTDILLMRVRSGYVTYYCWRVPFPATTHNFPKFSGEKVTAPNSAIMYRVDICKYV